MPAHSTAAIVTIVAAAACLITPLVLAQWVPFDGPPLIKQIALAAWGIGATVVAQRVLFRESMGGALRTLGFHACPRQVLMVAIAASLPMWLVIPAVSALTASPLVIAPNWPAMLLGVVIVNGLTEETIHRGFIFNHVRATRPFFRAATLGAAIFAAQHVYLVLTIGWAAGISSVILAALLTFPLAQMFESGGNSIVAPALLHTSSNAPMLIFGSSGDAAASLLVPYMGVVLASIYLVFLFRGVTAPRIASTRANANLR